MKVLLFTLLFGIAVAASIKDDKHNEVQASSRIGDYMKDALENLVDRIKDTVDGIKDAGDKVFDKVENLKDRLEELEKKIKTKSNETVNRLREKVQDLVKSIQENMKKQVTAVTNELNEISNLKVRDLITAVQERINGKIDSIRQYLKDAATKNEADMELDKLLEQLKNSELADIFNNFMDLSGHEIRHVKDLYKQLKDLVGKTDGVVKEKLKDLVSYVGKVYDSGVVQLIQKYQNLKAHLLLIVDQTKNFSVDAVKDALLYLKLYREHLGDMYDDLVESLKKVTTA